MPESERLSQIMRKREKGASPGSVGPIRQGPRPLALHLGTAALTWLSSRAALPLSIGGSLPWKKELAAAGAELRTELARADPEALAKALEREVRQRLDRFMSAVERYRHHPYRRTLPDPPLLWQEGTTRVLDFGAAVPAAAPTALFVPSLVNRSYILDLSPGTSFLRWLAGQGVRPLLVDWGRPGEVERGFGLSDYIAGRLASAIDVAARAAGPVALVGYCMGGNLALAAALRRQDQVTALGLLAVPWDFHAERPEFGRMVAAAAGPMLDLADRFGELSTEVIQALFYCLDPYLAPRKFLRFAEFEPGSDRDLAFVALEDWLNDGVPLAARVARECLAGWYGENTPGRGLWRVAGEIVDPGAWPGPALVMVPAQDRIVPPASAEALARLVPRADVLHPAAGHIGMMVSGVAETAVWRPLRDWLLANSRHVPRSAPTKPAGSRAKPRGRRQRAKRD